MDNKENKTTEQYAVFLELYRHGEHMIVLFTEDVYSGKADFVRPKRSWFGSTCSAVRYSTLEEAKREADRRVANSDSRRVAGVVPIDTGELIYREMDGSVKIGLPIYVTESVIVRDVREIKDYDVVKWEETLEKTLETDLHWVPESLR